MLVRVWRRSRSLHVLWWDRRMLPARRRHAVCGVRLWRRWLREQPLLRHARAISTTAAATAAHCLPMPRQPHRPRSGVSGLGPTSRHGQLCRIQLPCRLWTGDLRQSRPRAGARLCRSRCQRRLRPLCQSRVVLEHLVLCGPFRLQRRLDSHQLSDYDDASALLVCSLR